MQSLNNTDDWQWRDGEKEKKIKKKRMLLVNLQCEIKCIIVLPSLRCSYTSYLKMGSVHYNLMWTVQYT